MNIPNRSGYQVYQKNMYETASPHKLISLLYNAAVTNIQRAIRVIDEQKSEEANKFILKAQEIVLELMACLNFEQGGDIAANLREIYFYCSNQLMQANIHKDTKLLREVEGIIDNLRQAWQEIGKDVSIAQQI